MKIILFIVLPLIFGCSYLEVKETQSITKNEILIEEPFIINLTNGKIQKL